MKIDMGKKGSNPLPSEFESNLPDISEYPPMPPCKKSLYDRLTLLFDAWKKDTIANQEDFNPDGWKDDDYSKACAEYFINLAKRLNIEIS